MAPYTSDADDEKPIRTQGFFEDVGQVFKDIGNWIVGAANTINTETILHPYLFSLALILIWVWPHILTLPFALGKDAYRTIDYHVRDTAARVTGNVPRRRKRDILYTQYQSIVNAGYQPTPQSEREAVMGTAPAVHTGQFYEHEARLSVALRIVRWTALAWAAFILGREVYWAIRY